MNRLPKQIQFINELEKLKTIKRHNMTLDDQRPENSAEHSWHLAIMVPVLLEYAENPVDELKVIKLLLIHDLGEIYAGDTWLYDEQGKEDAYRNELNSFNHLISHLPPEQKTEMLDLFHEFEAQKTPEAKFAKVIDAIQPLLNHLVVAPKHYNPDKITKQQVLKWKSFIKDYAPRLWNFVEKVIQESVDKGLYHDDKV